MIVSEFAVIENNIITGIFSGEVDETRQDIIILPENHEVLVGDTLDYYNDGYKRKNQIQLIKEGLAECEKGYVLDGDTLREMTFEELVITGQVECPGDKKIVKGKLVDKTEEELWEEMQEEEKEAKFRSKRDELLNETDIELMKYNELVELGIISEDIEYKKALLKYRQELRDATKNKDFPDKFIAPEKPVLIAKK